MTDEIDLDWVKERDKVASEWATVSFKLFNKYNKIIVKQC